MSQPVGGRSARPVFARILVGIFILVLVFIGYGSVLDAGDFAAHHRTTDGVVTKVHKQVNCTGTSCSTIFLTTIRYPIADGHYVTFEADRDERAAIGERLRVYYSVTDPRDARLGTGGGERTVGFVLIVAGSCAVPVYVAITSWQRRRKRMP